MQALPGAQPLTESELGAWRGLLRASACICKQLDTELEAANGIALSTYEVLAYVSEADGERMRMCDLAASANLSRSGLTRLIDRLERDGLIERQRCSNDARGAWAKLTSEGRDTLEASRVIYLDALRRLFLSNLSPAERAMLATLPERVARLETETCC
ncbi:MAG TPA: MarR family transcriptional regulator [Baekduia sp.]|nr:MarR family transcriptional regulator [Baekduia sp.]